MRLKKSVIITFFVIMFGILSFIYLKNNKDIIYKNILSNNKKYQISYEEGMYNSGMECDRYYSSLAGVNKIFSYTEVEEGYPMYVLNGCAVELNYYLENTDDDVNACNVQREYAEKNIASDTIVGEYNGYCSSLTEELDVKYDGLSCSDAKNLIINKYLDYSSLYNNWYKTNCGDKTGIISLSDINKVDYNNVPGNCERKRIFNTNASSFDDLGFTGVLRRSLFDEKNSCDYPLFYINGYATTYLDYLAKLGTIGETSIDTFCEDLRTEVKSYADNYTVENDKLYHASKWEYNEVCVNTGVKSLNSYCEIHKEYIENNFIEDYAAVAEYNNYCSGSSVGALTLRESKNLYFSAIGSHGYECPATSSNPGDYSIITSAEGTCQYSFYNLTCDESNICEYNLPASDFPITSYIEDGVKKTMFKYNTGGTFVSWGNSYNTIEKSTIDAGGTIKLIFSPETEYVANYSDGSHYSLVYNLFNNCDINGDGLCAGNRNGLKENGSSEIKETKDANGNTNLKYCGIKDTAMLKSEIKSTYKYVTSKSQNKSVSSSDSSFTINQYCNISCRETFWYSYPSIFETVKSGTYFELLNYPNVESSLLCQENHYYSSWKHDYENTIKTEKKAYVDKVNAEKIDSWNSVTYTSSVCGSTCTSYTCGSNGNSCCRKYYYYVSLKDKMLKYNVATDNIGEVDFNYYVCDYGGINHVIGAKTKARNDFSISSDVNYEVKYYTAKSKRLLYEKMNKACFNALFDLNNVENFTSNNAYNYSNVTIDNTNHIFRDFIVNNGYGSTNLHQIKRKDESTKEIEFGYTSDKFYNLIPTVKFHYKSDYFSSDSSSLLSDYKEETLESTNSYIYDSGVTDWESENFNYKVIPYNINYGTVNDKFDSRVTNQSFIRNVTRKFVFSKGDIKEYYSNFQTGKITDDSAEANNSIYLGYVYPVPLTTSGENDVYFTITANTNLGYGANEILNDSLVSHGDVNGKNVYKCSYNVSNDIIVKEKTDGSGEDKYKKNFYVRSISTSDVDPNDRMSNGKLGANWANDRGISLIEIIEKKAEGNNTYNPNNLEYSFTLNAGTIEAIRNYNDTNRYDDFNLECNNMGGECESKFLNELAGKNSNNETRVNSVEVTGVNPIIKRESWKYYINGEWMKTKSITNNTSNWVNLMTDVEISGANIFNISGYDCLIKSIDGKKLAKETYDCLYRNINKGVLP